MKNQPSLTVIKRPDGKLTVKGLRMWSTGVFHGYGSPPEGDRFTEAELEQMEQAHREIGHKLKPRVYPGHPLNPMLKMLARPRGTITDLRRDGQGFLVADLDGVDPAFWEKATQDDARFSPDVKFGHTDPETGKRYPLAVVGLGVLGAVQPANSRLPSLQDYAVNYYASSLSRAYGGGEVRSYLYAVDEPPSGARPMEEDMSEKNNTPAEARLAEIQAQVEEALRAENAELGGLREKVSSFAAQFDTLRQALEEERAARQALEEQNAQLRAVAEMQLEQQVLTEVRGFADGLVREMRVHPDARDRVVAVLQAAAGVQGEVRGYALGQLPEAEQGKSLFTLLKELFASLPSARPEPTPKNAQRAFADADAGAVDVRSYARGGEASKALREKVNAYMAEHKVSYADAFREVVKQISQG